MNKTTSALASLLFAILLLSPPLFRSPALQPPVTADSLAELKIYSDLIHTGWENWSWADVDLQNGAPAYAGNYSIRVNFEPWTGLYLHHPQVFTTGYTHLRFFMHGGESGGQRVNLYAYLRSGGGGIEGPRVALPEPKAGVWQEVQLPLVDLGVENGVITGLVWQDASGSNQPALYLDEIALTGENNNGALLLSDPQVLQRTLPADGKTGSVIRLRVETSQGAADVASVSVRAGNLPALPLLDNGRSNDGAMGDGLFGGVLSLPPGTPAGELALTAETRDTSGIQTILPLGPLVSLAPAGGEIPGVLPQSNPKRPAWGTNTWSETPGQDWQVNSGVPWDYVYQYITYEWFLDGWGGNFVQRFVRQAWDKGYIPVVTVYMLLGLPPACGEGAACYAQKLEDPLAVQNYLRALEKAAEEAAGDGVVIFNLEPDFYGFMQQYSNQAGRPSHIRPDDPSSYPVALNIAGYPNDLTGFGRRMVDLIHAEAPNALVGPMASMWATNADPQGTTSAEAIEMGQRTADFILKMGGSQADLLFVEWSDRDAGSGLRPWWDDTDMELPRPSRAILWENALSSRSGKRLILWQVPVGNISLDDTCSRYRDNRAAYLFNHPRDFFEAGVIAVLFGGGAACMTGVTTDGGFVASQGKIAYDPPATPVGLEVASAGGASLTLRWEENSEPDLWFYRIRYTHRRSGTIFTREAGRSNAVVILPPYPDEWSFQVAAVDAMGNTSPYSDPVEGEVLEGARFTFIPSALSP